jgi:hypothetical protein
MTNEERKNILDQHKDLYDGYVTRYNQSNEQPLYVQDFANDKAGITVNNRGEVGEYRNMRINEDAHFSSELTPSETFEIHNIDTSVPLEDDEFTGLDKIGDGDDDLEHGTVGNKEFELNLDDLGELDEEEISSLTESVNKSLDMFRRFKNF